MRSSINIHNRLQAHVVPAMRITACHGTKISHQIVLTGFSLVPVGSFSSTFLKPSSVGWAQPRTGNPATCETTLTPITRPPVGSWAHPQPSPYFHHGCPQSDQPVFWASVSLFCGHLDPVLCHVLRHVPLRLLPLGGRALCSILSLFPHPSSGRTGASCWLSSCPPHPTQHHATSPCKVMQAFVHLLHLVYTEYINTTRLTLDLSVLEESSDLQATYQFDIKPNLDDTI